MVQMVMQKVAFIFSAWCSHCLRRHRLPSPLDPVDRARLLVGAEVAREREQLRAREALAEVGDDGVDALAHHVHPHRVAGGAIEPQKYIPSGNGRFDVF